MSDQDIPWYGVVFDLFFAVVAIGGVWLLPFQTYTTLNIETIVILFVSGSIFVFNINSKTKAHVTYYVYLYVFIVGLIFITCGMIIDPIWWKCILLTLNGRVNDAANLLDTTPHGNMILGWGTMFVFVSVVGCLRLAFIHFMQKIASHVTSPHIE